MSKRGQRVPVFGWCAMVMLVFNGCRSTPALTELVFEADDLPGCQLAAIPADAELPCGMTSNPHVGTAHAEIECFGQMTLVPQQHDHNKEHNDEAGSSSSAGGGDTLVGSLEEFMFSAYHGAGEAGVFGFRFADETAARGAAKALQMRAAGGENGMVEATGSLVAYVWYDDGASDCGFRLRDLIRQRFE